MQRVPRGAAHHAACSSCLTLLMLQPLRNEVEEVELEESTHDFNSHPLPKEVEGRIRAPRLQELKWPVRIGGKESLSAMKPGEHSQLFCM